MSYFYVDSTIGTRTTGGGTTKQTGTFDALGASNLYASRALAIADGAGSADIIVAATRHAESASSVTNTGPSSGAFLETIIAEDANCDNSTVSTTANEEATGTGDVRLDGRQAISGEYFKAGDDIGQFTPNSQLNAEDCTFEVTGSGDRCFILQQSGCFAALTNPTFKGVSGSVPLHIKEGARLEITCGVLESGPTFLTDTGFDAGGGQLIVRGLDISTITGTVFNNIGGAANSDDLIDIQMYNCPTASSFSWFNETLQNLNHRLTAINCANTSALAEYQFCIESWGGYVDDQDDSGIHRDETTAFPSGTKVSAHILTDSNASIAAPFWFSLPSIDAELATASTDTLRFYLASTVALDDTDFWIEITYKDGANGNVLNLLSTRNSERLTVASAGTALTTDSGSTWLDGVSALAGYNEYYIDVDTSGDVGADCVPNIKIFVALPSTAIYLDPVPDVVA